MHCLTRLSMCIAVIMALLVPSALPASADQAPGAADFDKGMRFYRARNYKSAIEPLEFATKAFVRPTALLALGFCYRQLKWFTKAKGAYERYLETHSEDEQRARFLLEQTKEEEREWRLAHPNEPEPDEPSSGELGAPSAAQKTPAPPTELASRPPFATHKPIEAGSSAEAPPPGGTNGQPAHVDSENREEVIVAFDSSPQGAEVAVDGRVLCAATPCSKIVSEGSHEIVMRKEGIEPAGKQLTVTKGLKVSLALGLKSRPRVRIVSTLAKTSIAVDGKTIGTSPLTIDINPGAHEFSLDAQCLERASERITLFSGETYDVQLSAKPRQAVLKVSAEDDKGNALEAHVLVDGQDLGTTPGRFSVSVCAKRLEVGTQDLSFHQELKLSDGAIEDLSARLTLNVGEVTIEPKSGLPFVFLPGGTFNFGCEPLDRVCADNEKPARSTTVTPYRIGQTAVTVAAFSRWLKELAELAEKQRRARPQSAQDIKVKFEALRANAKDDMERAHLRLEERAQLKSLEDGSWDGKYQSKEIGVPLDSPDRGEDDSCNGRAGRLDHPMNCVDWEEAGRFCAWLGGRLPTAEEREFAAKGGKSRIYPWGDDPWAPERANVAGSEDGYMQTAPVGKFPKGANSFGLLDMAGNVWEWTTSNYFWGKEVRGGSWDNKSWYARASAHEGYGASKRKTNVGFRCVQDTTRGNTLLAP